MTFVYAQRKEERKKQFMTRLHQILEKGNETESQGLFISSSRNYAWLFNWNSSSHYLALSPGSLAVIDIYDHLNDGDSDFAVDDVDVVVDDDNDD